MPGQKKKRWIYASLFGPIRSELDNPTRDLLCQSIPSFLSMVSTTMYSSKKHICSPYSVNKTKTMLTKNNGACVCCPLAWKGAGASTRALMMLDLCTAKVILYKFCCELKALSIWTYKKTWSSRCNFFQKMSKKVLDQVHFKKIYNDWISQHL